MFCISLLLFVFATFSPWAGKPGRHLSLALPIWREELYWSFQVVLYPVPLGGEEFSVYSWDFWFGPHDRFLLWDSWFSGDMQDHGLTFGWIHLFILQLLTVFSGIYVLVWRWREIEYLLVPFFFSFLSVLAGLELISMFMLVWRGFANTYWGLHSAILSTFSFLGTFLIRYVMQEDVKNRWSVIRILGKEFFLKGYWKLLPTAGLVIILSVASTFTSVLHKVSYESIGARGVTFVAIEYGFPHPWYFEVYSGSLGGDFAGYVLERFVADTIIYLIIYSIISGFIYWLYRRACMHANDSDARAHLFCVRAFFSC